MDKSEARERVTYHAPNDEARRRHETLSVLFERMLLEVNTIVPAGREQSIVFTKLEEAKMWASAGVARNQHIFEEA